MSRSAVCTVDDFAVCVSGLLSDIEPGVEAAMDREVPKAGREAAKKVKENARAQGWSGKTGSRYVAGFRSKTTREGGRVASEVGNADVPGLVHLLEKGHNTIGGFRVAGKPHMEPAFNEVSAEFEEALAAAVGEVLGS